MAVACVAMGHVVVVISTPLHSDNSALTDTSLRLLSRGCRDMQHLYLAGCSKVSDKGLMDLKRLKRIRVLNIADCTRYICKDSSYMYKLSSGDHMHKISGLILGRNTSLLHS